MRSLLGVCVIGSSTPAWATGLCTDANIAPDDAFRLAGCNGACTYNAGMLECDMTALGCGAGIGAEAWVVESSQGAALAWGQCTNVTNPFYCCETTWTASTVDLIGTSEDDELHFTFSDTSSNIHNLAAMAAMTVGTILAGDGDDVVDGSNDTGASYSESLFGESNIDTMSGGMGDDDVFGGAGADTVVGDAGDDVVVGGSGNDVLEGGDGDDVLQGEGNNDILRGGEGDDDLAGGNDADVLCDSVGDAVCATVDEQKLSGGAGNDKIYYANDPDGVMGACWDVFMDPTSNADGGTDDCGDSDDWGPGEVPANCENQLANPPNECL